MNTPWHIKVTVDGGPDQSGEHYMEFPFRPSEEELRLELAKIFSKYGFRFDENLNEVKDCELPLLTQTYPPTKQP